MTRIQQLVKMAVDFAGSSNFVTGSRQQIGFFEAREDHLGVSLPDGKFLLVEHNTPYFLLGFRPEECGELKFHREGSFPKDIDNTATIVFISSTGELAGVLCVEHCLRRIKTFLSKTTVRHMRDERCVWAGIPDVQDEPPVKDGTVVEFRKPGTHVWERVEKNPLCTMLDKVKVKLEDKPAKAILALTQGEQWSPSDTAATTETKEGDDSVSTTRRRQTPKATRAPKKSAKPKAEKAEAVA
jgi:hypothetical protein